jgi:hypothetical protein
MAERKHKWISGAVDDAHGQFREKAERAGMSTAAFARLHKNSPGLIGKQARLARVLMGMHHGHAPENTKHHEDKPKPKSSRDKRESRYGKKD